MKKKIAFAAIQKFTCTDFAYVSVNDHIHDLGMTICPRVCVVKCFVCVFVWIEIIENIFMKCQKEVANSHALAYDAKGNITEMKASTATINNLDCLMLPCILQSQ